jgi:hypothetical protein
MLANFWLFRVLAIKDFATSPPDLWITLKEFLTALKSPQGKNWTGLHVSVPHVFYHMVGDLHGMIIPFVDLASTYNYIEAVSRAANQFRPRPTLTPFTMLEIMSSAFVLSLQLGISVSIAISPTHESILYCHRFRWNQRQFYSNQAGPTATATAGPHSQTPASGSPSRSHSIPSYPCRHFDSSPNHGAQK